MSVYFAQVGRYIKVGFSYNPERRVKNLWKSETRYSRPLDCPLDAPVLLAIAPGGRGEESLCHLALEDFAAGGEFFVDEPPVRAFIPEAQAGRYHRVPREAGEFEPLSTVTWEDQLECARVMSEIWAGTTFGQRGRAS